MLSSELEYCLNEAFREAREARHEFLTVEHLLYSLLGAARVREVLDAEEKLRRAAEEEGESVRVGVKA